MTRDDIIRMAKEADLWLTSDERIAAVVRFANLVAAAEREACVQVCVEQEQVALFLCNQEGEVNKSTWSAEQRAAYRCAAAIRTRGEK